MWKVAAKVSGSNQYMDNDLLTNTQKTIAPPSSFSTSYLLLKSLASSLSSSTCHLFTPNKTYKNKQEYFWHNLPPQSWQSPKITFSSSQPPYATVHMAEDKALSWGQVACKTNKKAVKRRNHHHTRALCQSEIISSYSLPKTKLLLSWAQVLSVFAPPTSTPRYSSQSNSWMDLYYSNSKY